MKILCVSQNEYALIDKESGYDGLLTFGIQGCIAISAYSPKTDKKLLIHLDKDSSITEARSLLLALHKEDSTLKVTLVHRLKETSYLRNQTQLQIQQTLTSNQISFTNAATKTGTVVLMRDGTIRLDLQHMCNKNRTTHKLALPEASSFNILDHDVLFSSALDVQWNITNLNSMVDEVKPLHPLLLSGRLNNEAELLDMRIISILEETNARYPAITANQTDEIRNFIFNKFWSQFGKIHCEQLIEENNTAFEEDTADLDPQSEEYNQLTKIFGREMESYTKEIELQYENYFSKIAFQFLPQTSALKARHSPLEHDEPTTNLDFYLPLIYK